MPEFSVSNFPPSLFFSLTITSHLNKIEFTTRIHVTLFFIINSFRPYFTFGKNYISVIEIVFTMFLYYLKRTNFHEYKFSQILVKFAK